MKKRVTLIIFGLVLGLIAFAASYVFVFQQNETVETYVFKENVNTNVALNPDMFEKKEMPKAAVPSDVITDLKAIEGKILKGFTLKGSILRLPMLVEASETKMSGKLLKFEDANSRAIAIPLSTNSTVGGTVQTGDLIDLYIIDNDIKTGILFAERVEVLEGSPKNDENSLKNKSIKVELSNDLVEEYVNYMAGGANSFVSLIPLGLESEEKEETLDSFFDSFFNSQSSETKEIEIFDTTEAVIETTIIEETEEGDNQ
ncbi:Flp pilus assembly protein CpaB [Chengkuizengella axinellae]|uniref:SAF domain-containing protein n=1 Tax=Chengkuizengella axinellae TaxID=3064388 RepID=A0ABT9J3D0_9BACL|nr:hypothetical protein [Chengkuizengella sp. 2205SS18-9]MDP5276127.1 hypothetical protein [Chengkuizengella sp. 2205SS18-9]